MFWIYIRWLDVAEKITQDVSTMPGQTSGVRPLQKKKEKRKKKCFY
jgi:hypothetical protein